jgi:phosphoglycerol transferase
MRWLAIFLIDFTALALLALWHWLNRKFGSVTFDQLLFHFQANFGGHARSLLEFDPRLVTSAIENVIYVPAALALTLCCLREWLLKRAAARSERTHRAAFGFSLALLGLSAALAPAMLNSAGAKSHTPLAQQDLFAQEYVAPSGVEVTARNPRNLVVIYVESLEQTYDNSQAFGKNLLPRLTQLQKQNIEFGHYVQVPNTGWTMAALVSTMCGLPLKALGLFAGNRFDAFDRFMPNAKCLPEILRAHGYRTEFLQGATLEFAAKDRFLEQHGFDLLEGKTEIEYREHVSDNGEDSWRVYDDALIEIAKRHYLQLLAAAHPFLLTLLTVDTHTEADTQNASNYCRQQHGESYEQLIECTDEMIAGLVDWIGAHDRAHTTEIVVLGDHLVMFGNPKYNRTFQTLDRVHNRSPYHLFIDPARAGHAENFAREFTHFDLLPTMLSAAGFDIAGHRLGLGTDLFSSAPTLIESRGAAYVNDLSLQPASKAYLALWGL